MTKKLLLLLPLLCAPAAPAFCQPAPGRAEAPADAAAVRDKLASSLFARGDLADRIVDAGMADRFISLEGLETHADVRSALMEWIRLNPGRAADTWLGLKGSGGKVHTSIQTREMTWEFNPSFLAAIKALNAAAGSASVSQEAMEMASRRLYGEAQLLDEAPAVVFGGPGGRGGASARLDYADYRLDKAGLERELARAGEWLAAARPQGGRDAAGVYSAAFASYQDFVVAASALKGRAAISEREARRLEALRGRLRSLLSAMALRARSSALEEAGAALGGGGAPAAALLAELQAAAEKLEALAGRAASGGADLAELTRLVNAGEDAFAGLYMRYTVYDALENLRRRAAGAGFSCFNDYAVYRLQAAFFPSAPYPRALAELAAAAAPLEAALAGAAAGDISAAAGLDAAGLERSAAAVEAYSARNRAVQFFSWGIIFRPVELKLVPGRGRPKFRPAFGIADLAAGKKRNGRGAGELK
ncbi:MAG: hypothetical protein CVU79_03290 [Elusimicrobia bacterium HGW-Elusimicrobia-3]|nr:MAG: hypothetical protein CVU79_03290 [Elusimicrobia bacterium HGW-Elusimicrobia-3]